MSTLIFPSSPTNGQIYPEQPIPGVNQYIYNAQSDTWDLLPADCCVPNNNIILDNIAGYFNGTQTTFALTVGGSPYEPPNALQMIVTVGNIMQEALVDYDISGSTITFTTAPAAGLDCVLLVIAGGQAAPASNLLLDDIQSGFNGTQVTFPLLFMGELYTPVNEEQLVVNLGGIQQKPNEHYTVSGASITFTTPPVFGLNCFIIALYGGGFGAPGGSGGVTQIIAGTNVTIDPPAGTGAVTINASGGGGSSAFTVDASNNIWSCTTSPSFTTGCDNFLVGAEAGSCLLDGSYNTFIGKNSGKFATSWNNNFIGSYAGYCSLYGAYNNYIGYQAGYYATSGAYNIAIGACAGRYNDISYNVFIGTCSGLYNYHGYGNTFLGTQAGRDNTFGCKNTFIGSQAGLYNTTGGYNTAVGYMAGEDITTGSSNVFLGSFSGQRNFTGNYNLFAGDKSGRFNESGSHNIMLGDNTGIYSCSGSYNIFLGSSSGCMNQTGCYNTFIGTQAGETSVNSCNLVAIGTCAGRNAGGYNNIFLGIQSGYGSLGCYASGNVYIGSCVGYYGGGCYTFGNVSIGAYSGLYITEATKNVFLGYVAGLYNTTGDYNIFVGNAAGYGNTSGYANVFAGCYAGRCNTTGYYNIFLGSSAGKFNTVGYDNLFMGHGAGLCNVNGYMNNFLGPYSGKCNTSGCYNNFLGLFAGSGNTTGINNNFIGRFAGYGNTTGSDNIYVGDSTGTSNTTGSNNVYLGKQAGGGGSSTASGNVYLGKFAGYATTSGSCNTFIGFESAFFQDTGSNNIAIGCKAGQDAVFTLFSQSDRIVLGNNAHTNAYIKVNWTVTSDERDKTCITPIRHGSNFLNQLTPIQYNWKDRESGEVTEETPRYGFLAQEILAAEGDPAILVDDHDPENLKLRETMMIPVLVKAFQELSAKYEELANELATLKSQLN